MAASDSRARQTRSSERPCGVHRGGWRPRAPRPLARHPARRVHPSRSRTRRSSSAARAGGSRTAAIAAADVSPFFYSFRPRRSGVAGRASARSPRCRPPRRPALGTNPGRSGNQLQVRRVGACVATRLALAAWWADQHVAERRWRRRRRRCEEGTRAGGGAHHFPRQGVLLTWYDFAAAGSGKQQTAAPSPPPPPPLPRPATSTMPVTTRSKAMDSSSAAGEAASLAASGYGSEWRRRRRPWAGTGALGWRRQRRGGPCLSERCGSSLLENWSGL
jgi:hypothetical protein